MLTIYPVSENVIPAIDFIQPATDQWDKSFTASRVKYLIQTLSEAKKDVRLRVNAAEILFQLGRAQSSPGPSSKHTLMDNEWLASSADEICAKAKAILDDDAEDVQLRGLCLRFLKLDEPERLTVK